MDKEKLEWRWCLVGNIIDTRAYGQRKEIRYGTKNFSPGTKVYVNTSHWGDGGDKLIVIGRPRSRKQYIECVIRHEFICNWRIQKIYSPTLLKKMSVSEYEWWGNTDADRELILYFVKARNENLNKNEKYHYNTKEDLLLNLDKILILDNTCKRIRKNLNLNIEDVLEYCKKKILDSKCVIFREGRRFYCEIDNIRIVINASTYEILSANFLK